VRWTVEDNGRGGSSLYRYVIVNRGADAPVAGDETRAEIAEGVTDMQITYKIGQDPGYVDAGAVGTQWKAVTAAKVVLTLRAAEGGALSRGDVRGTENEVLTRQLVNVVAIRNRRGIL
jgi:type IV pilus assembly protein PilW